MYVSSYVIRLFYHRFSKGAIGKFSLHYMRLLFYVQQNLIFSYC